MFIVAAVRTLADDAQAVLTRAHALHPEWPGVFLGVEWGEQRVLLASEGHEAAGAQLAPRGAFRAASVTKMVTAACILRFARRGLLQLDRPVAALLAERLSPQLLSFFADVTVDELLGHRGGLPDLTDAAFEAGWLQRVHHRFCPEEMIALAAAQPTRPTRGSFAYSDAGFVALGLVLEALGGAPLEAVYRQELLDPCAMASTWLEGREAPRGPVSRHAWGSRDMSGINPTFDWAGGGLVSTAADLLRLLRCLAGGERPLLADMAAWRAVPAGHPHRSLRYGRGLAAIELARRTFVGHGGIWGAFAFLDPSSGLALAGSVNQYGPFGVAARPLLESLATGLVQPGDAPGR